MDDQCRRFEAHVLPHLDAAYTYARWLSRSPTEADDVLQDAMLRAFHGVDTLRGSSVKAWLLAIVRNCYLTSLKQQQRRTVVPLPEEADAQDGHAMIATTCDPESAAICSDEQLMLDRLIAALPEDYREVLILRELEDMSYREIAAVTGVPIGTVMSRLARARAALKVQGLQEIDGGPRAVR